MFVAHSSDNKKTFRREKVALSKPTNAYPYYKIQAFTDQTKTVYVLFQTTTKNVNQDETLLISPSPKTDFQIANVHKWKTNIYPMSSATLTEGNAGILGAWEIGGQVYFAKVNSKTMQVSKPISPKNKT